MSSETELLALLDDKYADFLEVMKLAYSRFVGVTGVDSSDAGQAVKEIESQLREVRPQSAKIGMKHRKTVDQHATVKKSVLNMTSIYKKDAHSRVDSAAKQATVKRPKLTRMGSKSLPGSPPRSPQLKQENRYQIIDADQVKLALSAFSDDDAKILTDVSRSLMDEYKTKTLADPDPEIVDFYLELTKGKMKKKKRSIASMAVSQSKIKQPMTPQLSSSKPSPLKPTASGFKSPTSKTAKKSTISQASTSKS